MKHVMILLVALMTLSVSQGQNDQAEMAGISDANGKEFLVDYFRETKTNLEQEVSGLTNEQMQFKPASDQWSISQILEHIILTEEMLFGMLEEQMNAPANPERRMDIKVTDEEVIAGVTDRSNKFKASKDLEGKGEYSDPEAAMDDLVTQREKMLNFINATPIEEFRNRVNEFPVGAVDAYQSLLYLAGHTARHTLQIEEVKSSENFPMD